MNYEYAGEKVAIFDKFYALLEPGGLWLSLETFVMDMRTRGHSVLWADAAFRAADVEKRGALNKFEYLFAVLSLQKDDRFYRNQRWIELRRRLLFTIYDRGAKGSIDEKDFMELINDISSSQDAPEAMGISNKKWSAAIEAGVQSGGHDFASISQVHAPLYCAILYCTILHPI